MYKYFTLRLYDEMATTHRAGEVGRGRDCLVASTCCLVAWMEDFIAGYNCAAQHYSCAGLSPLILSAHIISMLFFTLSENPCVYL